jgi:hypothetical protein
MEEPRFMEGLRQIQNADDLGGRVRGRFGGPVVSIPAASPGERLGELAAIVRAEASIAHMRYQKAARRPGVDMGLRILPEG